MLAGDAQLTAAHERALARGLPVAVFTEELFTTGHDDANRAAVVHLGRHGHERLRADSSAARRDPSHDMTLEAVYAKVMFLLSQGVASGDLAACMWRNLAGEITATSRC